MKCKYINIKHCEWEYKFCPHKATNKVNNKNVCYEHMMKLLYVCENHLLIQVE